MAFVSKASVVHFGIPYRHLFWEKCGRTISKKSDGRVTAVSVYDRKAYGDPK